MANTQDAVQHPQSVQSVQSVHGDLLSLVFPKLALEDKLKLSLINSRMYERVTNTPQMYTKMKPLLHSLEEVFSWINNCAIYVPFLNTYNEQNLLSFTLTYNEQNLSTFTYANVIEDGWYSKIKLKDLEVGEQYLLSIDKSKIEAIENMIIPTSKILVNNHDLKINKFMQYQPACMEINRTGIRDSQGNTSDNFIRIKDILAAIKYFLPNYGHEEADYCNGYPIDCKKITYNSINSTTIHIDIIFHKYSIMIYNN